FDLVMPADDRVELALSSELGEIAAEAVEGRSLGLPLGRGPFAAAAPAAATAGATPLAFVAFAHVVPQQIQDLFADVFELQAEIHEDLGRDAFLFAQEAQEQVLRADVVVVEVASLLDRVLDDLLGSRGLRQAPHGDHVGAGLDDLLDLEPDLP